MKFAVKQHNLIGAQGTRKHLNKLIEDRVNQVRLGRHTPLLGAPPRSTDWPGGMRRT